MNRLFQRSLSLLLLCFVPYLSMAQRLGYTVDLRDTPSGKIKVTLQPSPSKTKVVSFQMPAWAPGAYSFTNYGRFVTGFVAKDKRGRELPVERIDENRWSISNAQTLHEIEYYVRDSHDDSTSLFFAMARVDTNFVFANGTALFGYLNDRTNERATVRYLFPEGWDISCALDSAIAIPTKGSAGKKRSLKANSEKALAPAGEVTFAAHDFDELVDAPVMAAADFEYRSFNEGKAQYEVVVVSDAPFAMDSLVEAARKIAQVQTAFFDDTPYNRYVFQLYAPTFRYLPGLSQGALEHRNSSAYLLVNLPWRTFKSFGLDILSHELFHLWNVKRIQSDKLAKPDYTKAAKTTSLWLAEGVTDYYAHLLLLRGGLITWEDFLADIDTWHQAFSASDQDVRALSLEQLSLDESDFDIRKAELFYTKGPLVALMLDLEIRRRTGNTKSLDDVMLALNREAKQGKPFKDEELIGKIEKILSLDLGEFYRSYIAGSVELALDEYLKVIGVGKLPKASLGAQNRATVRLLPDGAFQINTLEPDTYLTAAGLKTGDKLLAVDGVKLTLDNFDSFVNLPEGASLRLSVNRNGQPIELTVVAFFDRVAAARKRAGYVTLDDATPAERALATALQQGIPLPAKH